MRVYWSIAIISPLWVDVPSSSECVRFGAKASGAEANYEVELREVLLQMVTYLVCDLKIWYSKELIGRVKQATKDVVKSEV